MPPSMMTPGPHNNKLGDNFNAKRGHSTQLSISDPSHHVTEAIGTLYGDEDDPTQDNERPSSYLDDGYQERLRHQLQNSHLGSQTNPGRQPPKRSTTDDSSKLSKSHPDNDLKKAYYINASNRSGPNGRTSPPQVSSPVSLRDVQADASGSQFPLTNIDNPTDIAQELSNLQALRRLSMDVGNRVDPDIPISMTLSSIPAIAPTGNDDENDPSRLLWVPARVHPELAPSEFKSFLENRVNSIRRRSGDNRLFVDGDGQGGNFGSLQRRKSMLSHQIDNTSGLGAVGYMDGAERLERQRSRRSNHARELSLEELVNDPAGAVQRLSQEAQAQYADSQQNQDDMPILPMAPGMGLRRSTRTTYRKGGSIRASNRSNLSHRQTNRHQDGENLQLGNRPLPAASEGHEMTSSEPVHENYSRPNRSLRRQHKFSQESPEALAALEGNAPGTNTSDQSKQSYTESQPPHDQASTPCIAVTEPNASSTFPNTQKQDSFPQRTSSQRKGPESEIPSQYTSSQTLPRHQQQNRQAQYVSKSSTQAQQSQTLTEGLNSNLGLPGGSGTRTDSLTFIPTLGADEQKNERKSKKDKDDDTSSYSAKSSAKSGGAWKWLKSVTDDKKRDENKKSKTKALAEKVQDNARLDVLQTSIDKTASKGRESLVLDRDSIDSKLQEERRKESTRKGDPKKEKDGSIFSSIFGGSKKKEEREREKSSKKSSLLHAPDEIVYKPLQPDVDYNWTRFPLLEERAIYRMAHIKLANPRRPLLSQVLLSNFMYSYLAIVQAMHPQMNIPISPQQKRLEEESRRKQQEQQYLDQQGLAEGDQQDIEQYDFDYHRSTIQYAESGQEGPVDYVDDAQIYEDDHGDNQDRDFDYEGSKSYDKEKGSYYEYRQS